MDDTRAEPEASSVDAFAKMLSNEVFWDNRKCTALSKWLKLRNFKKVIVVIVDGSDQTTVIVKTVIFRPSLAKIRRHEADRLVQRGRTEIRITGIRVVCKSGNECKTFAKAIK